MFKRVVCASLPFSKANHCLGFELLYRLILAKIMLRFVPFRKLALKIGEQGIEASSYDLSDDEKKLLKLVSKYTCMLSRLVPWKSTCLVQAFAAAQLLKKRNFSYTVYFGVNKDEKEKIIAHAWLNCGGFDITGGQNKQDFILIEKFGM